MLVVWMLYVNKIYIIFTHNMCYCFFFSIIKIIYYAAINAILIASVLYTVCHLWQPVLFTRCWPTGQFDKMAAAAGDLNNVSLVVVIVLFVNCCNNYSRFRYSYMYIMMFITYSCIFSYKLSSHIHTFGLLLILCRFIGLPRYSYQPITRQCLPGLQILALGQGSNLFDIFLTLVPA